MATDEADLAQWLETPNLVKSPKGCLVTIRNSTSSDKEALVVGAGVRFLWRHTFLVPSIPLGQTQTLEGDYMAGPVHVEIPPGSVVPFRFSDPRRSVHSVVVGLNVQFGNPNGYPTASYEKFFWKVMATLQPAPAPVDRIAVLNLEFRTARNLDESQSQRWFELVEMAR